MSTFSDLLTEDLRLTILRLLDQAEGYDLNIHILRDALARLSHRPSLDRLRGELAWLAEQQLVTTHLVGSTVVATATARGLDAAHGRARVPGVKRPGPD